jgi:cytoskeletal protein RodZ
MTREGSAIGFVVRVLLGGALISGLLLYASQALQKGPSEPQQAGPAEKIGPAMSQPRAPVVAATPQKVEPVRPPVVAQQQPAALPAPVPSAPALQPVSVPAAPVAAVAAPTPAPVVPRVTQAERVSLDPEIAVDEPQPEATPRPARQRGSAGCTSYKSYNPATQTYRSYDGKIKDCRP